MNCRLGDNEVVEQTPNRKKPSRQRSRPSGGNSSNRLTQQTKDEETKKPTSGKRPTTNRRTTVAPIAEKQYKAVSRTTTPEPPTTPDPGAGKLPVRRINLS